MSLDEVKSIESEVWEKDETLSDDDDDSEVQVDEDRDEPALEEVQANVEYERARHESE